MWASACELRRQRAGLELESGSGSRAAKVRDDKQEPQGGERERKEGSWAG